MQASAKAGSPRGVIHQPLLKRQQGQREVKQMGKRVGLVIVIALLVAVAASGCDNGGANSNPASAPSSGNRLIVYAAVSLQQAFIIIGKDFKTSTGNAVEFNFAGSQQLVSQLQSGAQADVLVTADLPTMQSAISASLVTTDSEQELATNSMVVIVPQANPANIQSVKDLANPGVKLDLADTKVPAGAYAQQVLARLSAEPGYSSDFKDKVNANVISKEVNVAAVVAKVQLGEADAGIVYSTDATAPQATPVPMPDTTPPNFAPVKTIAIPANDNVLAVYYIVKLKGASNPATADAFIKYAVSGAGRDTLARFGFGQPRPMYEP
jgi:molybdate transport system substrate-binding protein